MNRMAKTKQKEPEINGQPRTDGALALAETMTVATPTTATLAVVPLEPQIVRPAASPEQAKQDWIEYKELCDAILDDNDFTYYLYYREADGKEGKPLARGTRKGAEEEADKMRAAKYRDVEIRPRKKRSAWDKLARFYNLAVPNGLEKLTDVKVYEVGEFIVEVRSGESFTAILYQTKAGLEIVKASVTVSVKAPNGRVTVGEAVCSVSERRRGSDGFAHADHDVPTTAFTRASNRAISRAIGTGEVSAEEIESAPIIAESVSQPSSKPVAPVAQPPKHTQQVSNVSAPAEAKPEPKKETPVEVKQEQPVEAANVTKAMIPPDGKPDGFEPLGDSAKFSDRILHAEKFLYGNVPSDSKRESQLIKYALFAVPVLKAHIEAVPGRLNMDKWNAAMLALEAPARKSRLRLVEDYLKMSGREQFTVWAKKQAEEIFGKIA
jgi:hypothetical protein